MAVDGAPRTRYARRDDAHIAYQVLGEGPIDLALVPGFVSNVEHYWEMPNLPQIFERVASFSRLIIFDKRGTGLSDPVVSVPTLEERMQDLKAVLDAVRTAGLRVRAGLHTGECELIADDIGGMAVHIAARVMSHAGPDEVLVSSTVKDLVVGSGVSFEDRGPHALKGVPDSWRLYAVDS